MPARPCVWWAFVISRVNVRVQGCAGLLTYPMLVTLSQYLADKANALSPAALYDGFIFN
jgi:hypothetical protein